MQMSVREAAGRVGVTRQTIFKKIKDGELSATIDHRGNKQVDITELLRVYGQLQSNDSQQSTTVNKARQSKQSPQNSDLQLDLERSKLLLQMKERELQLAHERIEELKARESELKLRDRDSIEERMRLLGVIETQNRLLVAPSPTKKPVATRPPKPKTASIGKPVVKTKSTPTKRVSKTQKTNQTKAASIGKPVAKTKSTPTKRVLKTQKTNQAKTVSKAKLEARSIIKR